MPLMSEVIANAMRTKAGQEAISDLFRAVDRTNPLQVEAATILNANHAARAGETAAQVIKAASGDLSYYERTGIVPKVLLENNPEHEQLVTISAQRFLPTRECAERAGISASFYKDSLRRDDPGVRVWYDQPVRADFPQMTVFRATIVIQHDSGLVTLINPDGLLIEPKLKNGAYDHFAAQTGLIDPGKIPNGLLDRHPILAQKGVPDWFLGNRSWVAAQANSYMPVEATIDETGEIRSLRWHGWDTRRDYQVSIPIRHGPFSGFTGSEITIDNEGATLVQKYLLGEAKCTWKNGEDKLTTVRIRRQGNRITDTRTEPISWWGEEPKELPTHVSRDELPYD